MGKKIYIIYFLAICWLLYQCSPGKDDVAPVTGDYVLKLPPNFPTPTYSFANNKLTKNGIALGKRLFYDPRLSRDGTISCGFCHQQFAAFAHFDHPLSHGIDNRTGIRTVPSLFNLIWQTSFMWDGGVNHLEVQPLTPITDENEMGETLENVLSKLRNNTKYRGMFKAAFGTEEITTERLFKALVQFMATMNSFETKYDSVVNKIGNVQFTTSEAAGYTIFKAKCASCHKEPLFTDQTFRNNGLPYNTFLDDVGRMRITNSTNDYLKFKVPSLRNVIKSPPYMHDGRFYNIYLVFEHYNSGIELSPTVDPLVRNGLQLSTQDQQNLYQFLNTLTDLNFINNKALAEELITD
ncbi:cytochrome c peroxidase [Chitinophaga skermanii]|uniref:Cytochrome c peroxidase n=1 Tax=Chitinophaga skermanii TaxID=331697 RepID=A0A327QDT9_9BACT|nr:cytochrome c peroxidase [Chitinophaga skermanii]RAJ02481.1 cytochrome c peroxidase [Chitinophaga skermanii]